MQTYVKATDCIYCNVILYGLSNTIVQILQRVKNYAAHMIARFGRDEHVAHVLYDLHWLPIELHVHFKILLYTYKRFIEHAPSYICDIVQTYKLSKKLRCFSYCILFLKYSYAAETLWNDLGSAFKSGLKTFFRQYFYKK